MSDTAGVTGTGVPAGPGEANNGGASPSRSRGWWVWAAAAAVVLVAVAVIIWAVQDDDAVEDTAPATTTSTTTKTTTTESTATTVGVVVARVQEWLDDRYAESTPPSGVTGPGRIVCSDTGPIEVGGVFACELQPQTEPGFPLETAGVVIYVLDTSGWAAWTAGTDVPDSTEALLAAYQRSPKGLFCRDLLDPDLESHPFAVYGSTPTGGFFWSLVYWSLEGEPDRMDADRNGVPCETLYDTDVIAQVLAGGEVR